MITNPVLPAKFAGGSPNAGVHFLQSAVPAAISLGFVVGTIVFLFMLIMGAIQWMSSGGDKQALEGAKGKVTNALIGIVILFSLFAIIQLIDTFFGIKIMTLNIPTLSNNGGGRVPTAAPPQ